MQNVLGDVFTKESALGTSVLQLLSMLKTELAQICKVKTFVKMVYFSLRDMNSKCSTPIQDFYEG